MIGRDSQGNPVGIYLSRKQLREIVEQAVADAVGDLDIELVIADAMRAGLRVMLPSLIEALRPPAT